MGSFRRLTPFDDDWGHNRGQPIDRYYIDRFLEKQAGDGYPTGPIGAARVLEIGDARYARRFGATAPHVLDYDASNTAADIVGDLTKAETLPEAAYDCVICTQTLLLIYDLHAAVHGLHRLLAPGGTALVTLPGISRICRPEMDIWGDYWRFTTLSARRMFEEVFAGENVHVEAYGNVLSSAAFLYAMSAQDLRRHELDARDPNFELLIGVRAVKTPQRA